MQESEDNEDFSEYQDWEQEAIQEALDVVENWDDYVELPDREEANLSEGLSEQYRLSFRI